MFVSREYEREFDIRSVMDQVGVKYSENKTHFILHSCPNCNGKSKLYLDKQTKKWLCFKCVKTNDMTIKEGRGNLQTFLKLIGLSNEEIISLMKNGEVKTYTDPDMFTQDFMDPDPQDGYVPEITLPLHFDLLMCDEESVRKNLEAYRYLCSRHVVHPEVIMKFNLMYSKPMKRLVFPIYQEAGKIVGWQARDITDRWKRDQLKCNTPGCSLLSKWYFPLEEGSIPKICPSCGNVLELLSYPKSRNSKDFPKTELLFNQHNVDWSKPVIIVEGPFDCINAVNSVALMGKVLSPKQLTILLDKNPPCVILYLDGDEAGRTSTKGLVEQLSPFFDRLFVIPLKDGEDPGSFSIGDNFERISTRIEAREWFRVVDDDKL